MEQWLHNQIALKHYPQKVLVGISHSVSMITKRSKSLTNKLIKYIGLWSNKDKRFHVKKVKNNQHKQLVLTEQIYFQRLCQKVIQRYFQMLVQRVNSSRSARIESCEIDFILIHWRPNSTKWIYLGSIFICFTKVG